MKAITLISAFLGGAIVGCSAALLFAPEKGEDVRHRIKNLLNRKGIKITDSEIDELVAELSGSLEE